MIGNKQESVFNYRNNKTWHRT